MAEKIILLGHNGFLGKATLSALREYLDEKTEIMGFSSAQFNLLHEDSVNNLANVLSPETILVMCAGIKRHSGDTLGTLKDNFLMASHVAEAIQKQPVKRLVYVSSVAVYGEDHDDLHVTEQTSVAPWTSFYANARFVSECLFTTVTNHLNVPLLIVRPTTVYGPGDRNEKYGPLTFCRSSMEERQIVMWGDGSELRDLLFIENFSYLFARMIPSEQCGIVNMVCGTLCSFMDIVNVLRQLSPHEFELTSRPRSKNKINRGYDPGRLATLYPDFSFTKLADGVRITLDSITK